MYDGVVYIIEYDGAIKESLDVMLSQLGFRVASFTSGAAFLRVAQKLRRGFVLSDVRMPEISGIELILKLHKLELMFPVVLITRNADVSLAVKAMKAGAVDCIQMPFAAEDIRSLISNVCQTLNRMDSVQEHRPYVSEDFSRLSNREREVFNSVIEGHSNKETARALGISHRTVEIYRAKVMAKMHADTLQALILAHGSERAARKK